MAKTPVSEHAQVNFRMPIDLRDRIRIAAEKSNRSVTAEIVAALEKAYPAPPKVDPSLIQALFTAMQQAGVKDLEDPRCRPLVEEALVKWMTEDRARS